MISILISLYNEEERIREKYKKLESFLDTCGEEWELIFINDGSKDSTRAVLREIEKNNKNIRSLHLSKNHGQGAGLKIGALYSKGDIIVYSDIDFSIELGRIHALIEKINSGYDIAIASRWMPGSTILIQQPFFRRFLGKIFYFCAHLLFIPEIHDSNCGLKAYRGDVGRYLFGLTRSWRWAFNTEMLWLAQKNGFKIAQVPVVWSHDDRSKVHVFRDAIFTVWELQNILIRSLIGIYPILKRKRG